MVVRQGAGLKEDPRDTDPLTLSKGESDTVPLRVGSIVLLADPVVVSRVVIVCVHRGERVAEGVVLADTVRVVEADPQWVPPLPTPRVEGEGCPLALTEMETLE